MYFHITGEKNLRFRKGSRNLLKQNLSSALRVMHRPSDSTLGGVSHCTPSLTVADTEMNFRDHHQLPSSAPRVPTSMHSTVHFYL